MPWRKYHQNKSVKEGTHGLIYPIARGVIVREDVNDKWVLFVRQGSNRRNVTFGPGRAGLSEAIRKGELIAAKLATAAPAPEKEPEDSELPIFTDYCQKWLENHTGRWKHFTYVRYEAIVRLHIMTYGKFADLKVDKVSRVLLKDFLVGLRGKLAQRTVELVHSAISGIFEDLIEDQLVESNPARNLLKKILSKKRHRSKKKPDPFTIAERDQFLETAIKLCDPSVLIAMKAMLFAGVRLGEMLAMRAEYIDFTKKMYKVSESYKGKVFGVPKSGESRFVDLPVFLMDELRDYCMQLRKDSLKAGKGGQIDLLFLDRAENDGCPYSQRKIQDWMKRICKAAGLRSRSPHQLRHTYATIMLMAHQSPAYVQKQLGHSSIQITVDTYGHWIDGEGRHGLEEALRPVPNDGENCIFLHIEKDKAHNS